MAQNQALPLIGLYGLAGKQLIPAFQKIFATLTALRFNTPVLDHVLEDLGDRAGSQPLLNRGSTVQPLKLEHAITLDGVTYRYPNLEPDSGTIRVDETLLTPATTRNWQAALGYVPQHMERPRHFIFKQRIHAHAPDHHPKDIWDRGNLLSLCYGVRRLDLFGSAAH